MECPETDEVRKGRLPKNESQRRIEAIAEKRE
jgi:hypothetical protein